MARRKEPTVFTVEGVGIFPPDMLRYDQCWPKTQEDSLAMERSTRMGSSSRRERVTLQCSPDVTGRPTAARWESFGWKVVEA